MPDYPKIFRLRQIFEAPRVEDVAGAVKAQLARLQLDEKVKPQQTVAVTAGSRGIANIAVILRAIVEHFEGLGARPFIVPAMGTHAGSTAEGQQEFLEGYGVTEASMGCPIRATMETVVVCRTAEGFPVHFDKLAYEADHVVVCNRIKPHTRFVGPVESGLMKMMLIGLGKRNGAAVYHRAIQDYSFGQIIRSVAGEIFGNCRILAGVAVVENAHEQTAKIEAVVPAEFESREEVLLKLAREWMARIPFDQVDVLLIDRIGKNISGTGMDTNVVGRKFDDHQAQDDEFPKVRQIALRRLTPESHGNAVGMGMAEFCRSQLLDETDFEITRLNAITAGHVAAAMPPLDYPTDREMLSAALIPIGLTELPDAKLVWIQNTLELAEIECSTAYLEEARGRDDLEILSEPRDLPWDASGNLPEMDSLKVG